MSGQQSITEFLEARIAEDERVARDATQGRWEVVPTRGDQPKVQEVGRDAWLAITSSDPGVPRDANAQHIARHDPARVLAECAAKRAILEHANKATEVEKEFDDYEWQGTVERSEPWIGDAILLALAAVYKDHPDYREEWSVA